jgi:hypothetical protein
LNGERGEDGGAEEVMSSEGLEVGGDAGAGGGIVPGDGEEGTFGNRFGGGRIGRNRRHLRAT